MSVVPSNGSSRTTSTQIPSERVLTLGVYGASVPAERRLAELASLVRAAGGDVVHTMVQRRPANIPEDRPITSATYIGGFAVDSTGAVIVAGQYSGALAFGGKAFVTGNIEERRPFVARLVAP